MNSSSHNRTPLTFVCFIFLLASCTKNTVTTSPGPNIYIAGNNGTNPVLWKNGNAGILSSARGSASQVILYGNDIYVAGTSGVSESLSPGGPSGKYVYWKNGIQNDVSDFAHIIESSSIAVAKNNIYYANSNYWQNGSMITLMGEGFGFVSSTFASGNDIYVAGSDSVGDAVIWKNGVLNVLSKGYFPTSNSGSDPFALCIYVSGNDVYVGGSSIDNTAVYWKNGVATSLQSTISGSFVSSVNSIFVSGNDVYASAILIVPANGGSNAPAYWKNGVEHDLPLNGAGSGYMTSIFVDGQDVYATGWTSTSGAVYWINDVETILSSRGFASSIYVQ